MADVWAFWPNKSSTRLSRSGWVDSVATNKRSAVWAEKRDPRRAEFADPFSHWVRPVDGSAPPLRIQRGYSSSNVVAGDSFAAWWPLSTNAINVSTLDGTVAGKVVDRSIFVPARFAANGDLLAYASQAKAGRITVHVAYVGENE